MDILLQDIRYALRKLARTASFTIVAVATLALAIGATTAVFSIVDGVLLKPLPFHNPDEVMVIGSLNKAGDLVHLSGPDYLSYRDQTHSFVATAPFQSGSSANLSVAGSEPLRLNAALVGAKFFDILGMPMELGRGFVTGEDQHGATKVVVLSDKLWRTQFSGDRTIIGRSFAINGDSYAVVGVALRSLTFPDKPDLWLPFELEPWMIDPSNRGAHFIRAIGRVRPGVTADAAKRDMLAVGNRLQQEFPASNATFSGTAQPVREFLTGDVRKALFTMFGAVLFVLLIACANVANLLLVRANSRETEMAVRTALGAGRSRIARQLVTESVLLSLAGAAVGGALAAWAVDAIVAFGPKGLPRLDDITVDARVLVFSAVLAIITGVAFGLVPAFHATKAELGQMLREGMRGAGGRRGAQRTRGTLVVVEMALAVVLLVGAGLLIRSFVKLLEVDPGFRTEHVLAFNITLPSKKYPIDRDLRRFGEEVRDAVTNLPGTQSVAISDEQPLAGHGMTVVFDIDGRPPQPADKRMTAAVRTVTSTFFPAMGIRLLRGRTFTKEEEGFGPPPVVVVTQSFARKYFPTEEVLGKHITLGISHDTAGTNSSVAARGAIVGVINDIHQADLSSDAPPAVYVGWGTLPLNDMTFLVRSRTEPGPLATAVRERVHAVDAEIPIYDLRTMDDAVAESVAQPRFYMMLLTAFAAIALMLAALGIYGVISYSVSQRTRELGIRIALGATQDRVVRLVLGQGFGLTVLGIAAGLLGAFWLVHLLAALLYGIGAADGLTFGAVAIVLLGVAAIASYLPARRAARVDPVIAMRAE